jgi:hypothetical protein
MRRLVKSTSPPICTVCKGEMEDIYGDGTFSCCIAAVSHGLKEMKDTISSIWRRGR